MKIFSGSLIILLSIFIVLGCNGKRASTKNSGAENDTISVPDTGYTGIKQYMSGTRIAREVTFKNGVKEGLMKTFYISGKVRQTFWYEKDMRQDTSRWYFEEGQLFRTTPYKNDTIDGIQIQYYRTGKLKARIGYKKGLRTTYFEEFTMDGKLVSGYPQLVVKTEDSYKSKGLVKVTVELTDKSDKVRFYRGDLSGGIFDTAHCEKIKTVNGIGSLYLKKTTAPKSGDIGIVAEILTGFGNNYLAYKKIELPYKDLN